MDVDGQHSGGAEDTEVHMPEKSFPAGIIETQDLRRHLLVTKEDPVDEDREECLGEQVLTFLFYVFPILDWGSHYNFHEWLLDDIFAGVTTACLAVPQVRHS